MTDESDVKWFNKLSQGPAGEPSEDELLAQSLHSALKKDLEKTTIKDPVDDHDVEQFLFRLNREGLLDPNHYKTKPSSQKYSKRISVALAGLAATLLIIMVVNNLVFKPIAITSDPKYIGILSKDVKVTINKDKNITTVYSYSKTPGKSSQAFATWIKPHALDIKISKINGDWLVYFSFKKTIGTEIASDFSRRKIAISTKIKYKFVFHRNMLIPTFTQ